MSTGPNDPVSEEGYIANKPNEPQQPASQPLAQKSSMLHAYTHGGVHLQDEFTSEGKKTTYTPEQEKFATDHGYNNAEHLHHYLGFHPPPHTSTQAGFAKLLGYNSSEEAHNDAPIHLTKKHPTKGINNNPDLGYGGGHPESSVFKGGKTPATTAYTPGQEKWAQKLGFKTAQEHHETAKKYVPGILGQHGYEYTPEQEAAAKKASPYKTAAELHKFLGTGDVPHIQHGIFSGAEHEFAKSLGFNDAVDLHLHSPDWMKKAPPSSSAPYTPEQEEAAKLAGYNNASEGHKKLANDDTVTWATDPAFGFTDAEHDFAKKLGYSGAHDVYYSAPDWIKNAAKVQPTQPTPKAKGWDVVGSQAGPSIEEDLQKEAEKGNYSQEAEDAAKALGWPSAIEAHKHLANALPYPGAVENTFLFTPEEHKFAQALGYGDVFHLQENAPQGVKSKYWDQDYQDTPQWFKQGNWQSPYPYSTLKHATTEPSSPTPSSHQPSQVSPGKHPAESMEEYQLGKDYIDQHPDATMHEVGKHLGYTGANLFNNKAPNNFGSLEQYQQNYYPQHVPAQVPVSKAKGGGLSTVNFPSPTELHELKKIKGLGGSTGADLVEDKYGNKWVMKKGASPEHLENEALADKLYQILGANIPESRLYRTPTGGVKLSRFVPEAKILGDYLDESTPEEKAKIIQRAGKDFAVHALLANWDAVGAGVSKLDNVVVDANHQPWTIDTGGSLRYKATGPLNPDKFHGEVPELDEMRNPRRTAGKIFKDVDNQELADQIDNALAKRDDVLAAINPQAHKDWEELYRRMSDRFHSLHQYGAKLAGFNTDEYTDRHAEEFKNHLRFWHDRLSTKHRNAIGHWTGSGYEKIRPVMRGWDEDRYGTPLTDADRKYTEEFVRAVALAPYLNDIHYRGERRHSPDRMQEYIDAVATGKPYQFPAHSSASVDEQTAQGFADFSPTEQSQSVVMKLKGRARAINPNRDYHMPGIAGERELILPKEGKWHITKFIPHHYEPWKHYLEGEEVET